ncbi:MAG: hypothetical protein PVSMB4_05850 [Ktedonobacterales bacterium]
MRASTLAPARAEESAPPILLSYPLRRQAAAWRVRMARPYAAERITRQWYQIAPCP